MKKELTIPNIRLPHDISEAEGILISLGSNMQEHAYRVGKILLWVKEKLNHGQFEVWVDRKMWFTSRTARRFMHFAEEADLKGELPTRPHYYIEGKKSDNLSELENAPPPQIPKGKFNVIYADPPWQYSNSGFDESASQKYPTMANEEIYELIESFNSQITDPAVLFLWVTAPFLDIGLHVCEAWSFQYKQNLVWIKNKGPSMGWFVQSRHEHLFIATRGEGMHPKIRPVSYFEATATAHSKKPELIYKLIEEMYPNGKYLELFARNKREGWESWGKETDKYAK